MKKILTLLLLATPSLLPASDLTVSKVDSDSSYFAGTTIVYTVTVTNDGVDDLSSVLIQDSAPLGASILSWSCAPTGSTSCPNSTGVGNISETVPVLSAGDILTYTVRFSYDSSNILPVTNTAVVSSFPFDDNIFNNSASDTNNPRPIFACVPNFYQVISGQLNRLDPITGDYIPIGPTQLNYNAIGYDVNSQLMFGVGNEGSIDDQIIAVDGGGNLLVLGVPSPEPGESAAFATSNAGDMDASGNLWLRTRTGLERVNISEMTYDRITFANGSGNNNANYATADIVFVESENAFFGQKNGNLVKWDLTTNTRSFVVVPGMPTSGYGASYTDNQGNLYMSSNSGGVYQILDYDTPTPTSVLVVNSAPTGNNDGSTCPAANPPFSSDISVTKDNGTTQYTPGASTTYDIVISNASGPNTATGVSLVDNAPAGSTITGWTCTASSDSACSSASGGAGNINETNISVAVGGNVTYQVTVLTDSNRSGDLMNTATVSSSSTDNDTGNNSATDTDNGLALQSDISVTKDDSSSTYIPGTTGVYSLAVTNDGPSDVSGVSLSDLLPAGVQLRDKSGGENFVWECSVTQAGTTAGFTACPAANGGSNTDTQVNLNLDMANDSEITVLIYVEYPDTP